MKKMHQLAAAMVGGALAATSQGQVSFVSQDRSITAIAVAGGTDTQTLAAPGFGLFDEEVTASIFVAPIASGFGVARQTSSFVSQISPTPVVTASVSGFVQGTGSGSSIPGGGSGRSSTELVFTVGRDTAWDLTSDYFTGSPLGGYINTVMLERLLPTPAILADHSDFGVVDRFSSGVLTPGTYRFVADFYAFGGPLQTTVNFDVDLRVLDIPAPSSAALVAVCVLGGWRRVRR